MKGFTSLLAMSAVALFTTQAVAQDAYQELANAKAGEYSGKKVTMFGTLSGEDTERFRAAMSEFEKQTGMTIEYEGSKDFETLITVRAEGGNAPDIAGFSQPGLLANLVRKGYGIDLSGFMSMDQLKNDYIQSWLDLATIDGKLVGVFYRASTKSLVWYPTPQFEEAGYAIPQTWAELQALMDKMVADGKTPWCVGTEHAGATGWVATDWVEDILLRTAGPDVYDKWVKHEIPFNAPEVKEAVNIMMSIWGNEQYVYGGTTNILSTSVADAQRPMFDNPPSCWLYRQADWASSFFPEGKTAPKDSKFFYLPPIKEEFGKPVLGAGDVYAMFNDRPEVRAVMEFLATPEAAKGWIEKGGFVSPNKSVPLEWYPDEVTRKVADIMKNATVFRFDASDLMPGAVGTGSFWSGMVKLVEGADVDATLQEIENSWPKE